MTDPPAFSSTNAACAKARRVGAGTRVWAFAHVLPGASIGADCNICDHVFIENDVIVGDGSRSSAACSSGTACASATTSSSARTPPSPTTCSRAPKSIPTAFCDDGRRGRRLDRRQCDDPARRAHRPLGDDRRRRGGHQGRAALCDRRRQPGGASSATRRRPTATAPRQSRSRRSAEKAGTKVELGVGGSELWRLPYFSDLRGDLTPIEFGKDLPFVPQRSFVVYGVPVEQGARRARAPRCAAVPDRRAWPAGGRRGRRQAPRRGAARPSVDAACYCRRWSGASSTSSSPTRRCWCTPRTPTTPPTTSATTRPSARW